MKSRGRSIFKLNKIQDDLSLKNTDSAEPTPKVKRRVTLTSKKGKSLRKRKLKKQDVDDGTGTIEETIDSDERT